MIITDGTHLVSTTSKDELHKFADRMGLKRCWYQAHPRHPHYDLTTSRALQRAIDAGATKVSAEKLFKTAWWSKEKSMPKFIQITRSDASGSYVNPLSEMLVQAEFDDLEATEPGTSITLTVVEMTQEEYDNLPEFMGW